MHERIYVCHTYYHVYVTCLKELARKDPAAAVDASKATLVLSKMSTGFGTLAERARTCGLFEEVIEFDEKRDDFFPELAPLRKNTGSIITNMFNRIRFCKRYAELEAPYVPVDFRQYKDIYVFCDSDPVGYYLNANRIPYHAVEDGLNCLKHFHAAKFDNRGAFGVKAWMARMGWIFIQNGYAKYCIDMEVNDVSVIPDEGTGAKPRYVEVPRRGLVDALTEDGKRLLCDLFIENMDELRTALSQGADKPRILVLTEKIFDETERSERFAEIVNRYRTWNGKETVVMVKPHPRDETDYRKVFAGNGDTVVLASNFPVEMLNYIEGLAFDAVVAVFTQTDAIRFAQERISLRDEFTWAAPENVQAGT